MTSPPTAPASATGAPTVLVGRLAPLPGVALRDHPDRGLVKQLLQELRRPLCALRDMLDECREARLPRAAAVALAAAEDHARFVQQLTEEFAECGRLEQDLVRPAPSVVTLCDWLDARFAAARATGEALGVEVATRFRSLVPDRVLLDHAVAARALDAVLQVALLRAQARRVEVRVAFAEAIGASRRAQLTFELATRGGGYAEVELGYAFQPFRVRDPVGRPLLGLTIAQRLCELLGGELSIDSPGRSVCHYRMIVEAAPVADAEWVDPVGRPGQARLGRVQPQG